jgi:drug/metabolite transporter (DMT)-like permease
MVLSTLCWGLATVLTKGVLAYVPPMTLLVVQMLGSVTVLSVAMRLRRLRLPVQWQTVKLGYTGLLEPGLAYTFGIVGLKFTSASNALLIGTTEPIIIVLLAWLQRTEP